MRRMSDIKNENSTMQGTSSGNGTGTFTSTSVLLVLLDIFWGMHK